MSTRPTSEWMPIDRLVPHPANANEMTPEMMEKLEKNIAETGQMPPIIVRSLESTVEFTDELEAGKLQIIDGEHRWRLMKARGATEVEVRIWANISDDRAKVLLLTLNRLHGRDNAAKRNKLIRELAELTDDTEGLAAILPESVETLTKTVTETTKPAVEDAKQRAAEISTQQPFTVFMEPTQAEVVRRAIKQWLTENDPDRSIQQCREGAALAGICVDFVDVITDDP